MITNIMIIEIVSTVMKLERRVMIFHFTCGTPNVYSMSFHTVSCAFANSFSFLVAGCCTDKLNMGAFGYIMCTNHMICIA